METLLVTGGSGFIGSNFVRHVLAAHPEARVVNVDALTYAADPGNLADAARNPRYAFVCADVRDAAAMADVFARFSPDTVVHFAAETHVDRSIAAPLLFHDVNAGGTVSLLEAARAAWGVQPVSSHRRLFLHVSTDEVYGHLPLASSGDDAFRESAPLRPRSPYAASKAAAEMYVRAFAQTYGLPTAVVRCSNNYGPRQHAEKLIPKAIACAFAGEPFPLYGAGGNVRDWLHVDDCCRGIMAAVRAGRPGEAYNLGGSCPRSNAQVLAALHRELPRRVAGLTLPTPATVRVSDRPGHDLRYAMNCEKAARELGWRPRIGFEEGLRSTILHYASERPGPAVASAGAAGSEGR